MKTDILRAAAESPLARTIKVQEVAVRMTCREIGQQTLLRGCI